MAIKDTSKKPYIVDNDSNIKVGIDLPIRRDDVVDGWFASTKTTIEAVKNNIRNLLNTNTGERLMQPSLGIPLRRFLFEQINEEVIVELENEIENTLSFWLPFVVLQDLKINFSDSDNDILQNEINIDIIFSIKNDPTTRESISVGVGI